MFHALVPLNRSNQTNRLKCSKPGRFRRPPTQGSLNPRWTGGLCARVFVSGDGASDTGWKILIKVGLIKDFHPMSFVGLNAGCGRRDHAISPWHSLDVNQLNLFFNVTRFSGLPLSDSASIFSTTSKTASASISFNAVG